jgi:hypothetical protein
MTPVKNTTQLGPLAELNNDVFELKRDTRAILQRVIASEEKLEQICNYLLNNQMEQTLSKSETGDQPFATVKEAATIARKSECTIRRWLDDGILTKHRPPNAGKRGRILISRDELARHLATIDDGNQDEPNADMPRIFPDSDQGLADEDAA